MPDFPGTSCSSDLISDSSLAREVDCVESPEHMSSLVDTGRLTAALADRWWRLNHLYWIKTKDDDTDDFLVEAGPGEDSPVADSGAVIRFTPNWAQRILYRDLHYRNAVLKARQLGVTTFMCVFCLDWSVFNSAQNCGIIAHKLPDANSFFQDKILFAYDRLPAAIRNRIGTTKREGGWVRFTNDSWIRVSTSMRSATINVLHISEYGKICAEFPKKAREIATGALQAVPATGIAVVESTAEGASGRFFRMCDLGMLRQRLKRPLTRGDYKLFFFPWWKEPSYCLPDSDAAHVDIPEYLQKYFEIDLAQGRGIELSAGQKAWYVKKLEEVESDNSTLQGSNTGTWDDMRREYPSYAEEAFHTSIEGAYYRLEFSRIEKDGRIGRVPHTSGIPVDTWWDIGVGDDNSIWFTQTVKKEIRVLRYYSNSGVGLPHYVNYLHELRSEHGYVYGRMVGPHDFAVREYGSGLTRLDTARQLGIEFEIAPKMSVDEGIHSVRTILSACWFDENNCSEGLKGLRAYKRRWDKSNGRFTDTPHHDWASHPADAFRTLAMMHSWEHYSTSFESEPVNPAAWG